jgi:hypothetical protein
MTKIFGVFEEQVLNYDYGEWRNVIPIDIVMAVPVVSVIASTFYIC